MRKILITKAFKLYSSSSLVYFDSDQKLSVCKDFSAVTNTVVCECFSNFLYFDYRDAPKVLPFTELLSRLVTHLSWADLRNFNRDSVR